MPDLDSLAKEARALMERLYPLHRSITGDGVRTTLKRLAELTALTIVEVPSRTQLFDWTVPDEWSVREAFIRRNGVILASVSTSNLALISYSEPFVGNVTGAQLKRHLVSIPDMPDAIPYRTTYYHRTWGFCVPHRVYKKIDDRETYEVCVDTTLGPGSLTYAHGYLQGEEQDEVLISSYCCHPSMANDNLSGIVVSTLLFREICRSRRRYSYRFVIAPETIGAIAFIHDFQSELKNVIGGTVVATCAGRGRMGVKVSFEGNHAVDRAARAAYASLGIDYQEYAFAPDGSDERQYASPGVRIPTVTFCKSKYHEYDEYHTSLDDLAFVDESSLRLALEVHMRWIETLEQNQTWRRLMPHCEYQLGRRGLYPLLGGAAKTFNAEADKVEQRRVDALSWLMFGLDGKTDLLAIAERSGLAMEDLYDAARALDSAGLIENVVPTRCEPPV